MCVCRRELTFWMIHLRKNIPVLSVNWPFGGFISFRHASHPGSNSGWSIEPLNKTSHSISRATAESGDCHYWQEEHTGIRQNKQTNNGWLAPTPLARPNTVIHVTLWSRASAPPIHCRIWLNQEEHRGIHFPRSFHHAVWMCVRVCFIKVSQ